MGGCKSKLKAGQGGVRVLPTIQSLKDLRQDDQKKVLTYKVSSDGKNVLEEEERRRLSVSAVPEEELERVIPLVAKEPSDAATVAVEKVQRLPSFDFLDRSASSSEDVFSCSMLVDFVPSGKFKFLTLGEITEEEQPNFTEKNSITFGNFPPNVNEKYFFGFTCKKGLKPESPNQDDFIFFRTDTWGLYGVFDGHGPFGHIVSHLAHQIIPYSLLTDPRITEDPKFCLKSAFMKVQRHLEESSEGSDRQLDISMSGTTATVVLQRDNMLYVAHVGDSRAVLGRRSNSKGTKFMYENLTSDHKPTRPDERKRIEESGGEVKQLEGDVPYRVFMKGLLLPGLAMSRALGDSVGATVGVCSVPEVSEHTIEGETFLIISSDGVWEFISSQEAVDYVANSTKQSVQAAVDSIASEAIQRWIEEEGNVVDDVTCLVSWLN